MTRSHSLAGKEKLKAWNTWTAFPTVALAFLEVGMEKANLSQNAFEKTAICCVHVWKEQCSDNSECSKAKAVLPTMQSHQHIYLHRAPRLPSPSAWGWTKDSHGSHYGQHFVRLRTRTTSLCTVAANKTVKQDASVQLPTSHVLPYATLKETAV